MNTDLEGGKARQRQARFWKRLVRFTGPFWARKFRYTCDPIDLEGPYLLIANHASNADPILVGAANPRQALAVVGSEHLERLGWISRLLTRFFRLIPRSKASSGLQSAKQILQVLKQGQPVLLFAEGDCTWDGVSKAIFPATGKLAKLARVPLVTYRLEGNYMRKPRWARKARKGPVRGRLVRVYSPDDLAAMRPEEIDAAIDRDLCFDGPEAARQTGTAYRSRALAEGLEQALCLCPACGGIGTLQTKGSEIFCPVCGLRARLSETGGFSSGPFPTVREWDLWQTSAMERLVREENRSGLFPGRGKLTELPGGTPRSVEFSLDLQEKAIVVDGKPLYFSGISDAAMVKTNRLLFTSDGQYCEILAKKALLRPYLTAVSIYQKETE